MNLSDFRKQLKQFPEYYEQKKIKSEDNILNKIKQIHFIINKIDDSDENYFEKLDCASNEIYESFEELNNLREHNRLNIQSDQYEKIKNELGI